MRIRTHARARGYLLSVTVACIAFVSVLAALLSGAGSAASAIPSLFVNDAPYSSEQSTPLEITNGLEYVPIYMFAQLSNGQVGFDQTQQSYYVKFGSAFVAFDITNHSAFDSNGNRYQNVYTYSDHGVFYVPAMFVCNPLGLKFESDRADGTCRISDSSAKLTLAQLVAQYNTPTTNPATTPAPTTAPTTTETTATKSTHTSSPTTSGTTTEPTTPPPPPADQPIAFEFGAADGYGYSDADSVKLADALAELSRRGLDSAVYITPELAEAQPQLAAMIIASGQRPGLLWLPGAGTGNAVLDAGMAQIDAANDALYAACRIRTNWIGLDLQYAQWQSTLSMAAFSGGYAMSAFVSIDCTQDAIDALAASGAPPGELCADITGMDAASLGAWLDALAGEVPLHPVAAGINK